MIRKTILLFASIMLFTLTASAGKTYYSKLTVKTADSAKGKVYASTTNVTPKDSDYKDDEVTISQDSDSQSHTYYLYTQPAEGYVLDYWDDGKGGKITDAIFKGTAEATDQNSATQFTLTAHFIERPPIQVKSNDISLGTATITKGTNAINGSLTVTAAFVYSIPKGDYWNYFSKSVKFDGWYNENEELVSTDKVYTFTITEKQDLTARFSWKPYITQADGYYFVRSAIGSNGRGYINVISDYAPSFSATNRTLKGSMEMVFDDTYISDPACVMRIKGTNYVNHTNYKAQTTILKNVELIGQGISTKKLTNYVFEIRTGDQQGFYKLYYSRANLYNAYNGELTISSDQTGTSNEIMRLFDFEPLDEDHIDEFYFGAKPAEEMYFDGGYWTSMYTSFPYECWEEDGVEAYYINDLAGERGEGVAVLTKIEDGKVPAYTAVLLKCQGLTPGENRLLPLMNDPAPINDNLLKGTFQLNSKTTKKLTFEGSTMRVLSVGENDQTPGFYKLDENTELLPNKAYLDISTLGEDFKKIRLQLGSTTVVEGVSVAEGTEDVDAPVYNLMGQKVRNLVPGQIYIKNGKKFIAR